MVRSQLCFLVYKFSYILTTPNTYCNVLDQLKTKIKLKQFQETGLRRQESKVRIQKIKGLEVGVQVLRPQRIKETGVIDEFLATHFLVSPFLVPLFVRVFPIRGQVIGRKHPLVPSGGIISSSPSLTEVAPLPRSSFLI